MARKFVTDSSLGPLIGKIARLVHMEGSVLATSRRLNDALAVAGKNSSLYPNRLTALLSDDPAQSVNDQTIANVEVAVELVWSDELEAAPETELEARIRDVWLNTPTPSGTAGSLSAMQVVAEVIQLPLAVVRVALTRIGAGILPLQEKADSALSAHRLAAPDWSYQEDAVRASLAALRESGDMKAGLVLPTGGGKTRVAMRIALRMLTDSPLGSIVLWVTHRRFLRTMATRELQRAIVAGTPDLPDDSVKLLANRVEIILVANLASKLDKHRGRVALVVVDEAHHAAAPSYAPLFAEPGLRGLFLTATPNRTDANAIGIDRIAYTITYRELFRRRVLVEPRFERPFVVPAEAWRQDGGLDDLCDYVLRRSRSEFVKTIVVASRVDYVEKLHTALLAQLALDDDAVITPEEIGFVHGAGCSSDSSPENYLDEFTAHERGVLVTTAQMLGEGYDDPKINAVVMTYPTTSMVQLMQIGGRALRASPGKNLAYIVQAKESDLSYHFEQRWLYQDIVDALHPRLIDFTYSSKNELIEMAKELLSNYRVDNRQAESIEEQLLELGDGETVSILLTGMPYAGASIMFNEDAEWHAVPVTEGNRELFISIFNDFSEVVGEVKASEFLSRYIPVSTELGSQWHTYRDMLTAMEYARRECASERYVHSSNRPYDVHQGTTWLTYVTLNYSPTVPFVMQQFLEDAVNRHALMVDYCRDPQRWSAVIKVDYPLDGSYACLLDQAQAAWCAEAKRQLTQLLHGVASDTVFAQIALWRSSILSCPLPQWFLDRFESLIGGDATVRRWLLLREDGGT